MKQYHDLLEKVLREGTLQNNRTGIKTYSIVGEMLSFDMKDGFPAITTKKLAFNAVKGELLGFLRGYTNAADFRKFGCNIWNQNANENEAWLNNSVRKGADDLGCIYGSMWTDFSQVKRRQPNPKIREGVSASYLGVGNSTGASKSEVGKTWEGMMSRCYNKKDIGYKLYGGKGVHVCNDWLEFAKFEEDVKLISGWEDKVGTKSFEYQLDKDLKGDGYLYSKDTCCWLSAKENGNLTSKKTYIVEKGGVEYQFTNIVDFCKDQGVEAKNFSDLWTGNKNAKTRGGFKLVKIIEAPKEPEVVDQLKNALDLIANDPTSRRIRVTAWNPLKLDQMALPPCHTDFQFYVNVETRELSMTMNQRSCDLFLGIPFNIASYALLLHIVAEATGYTPRHLKMFLGDVHIYENHIDQVKEQLSREAYELPWLMMKQWDNEFVISAYDWIQSLEPDDFDLSGYDFHPPISAPMAV